jgi:hypothetical protein
LAVARRPKSHHQAPITCDLRTTDIRGGGGGGGGGGSGAGGLGRGRWARWAAGRAPCVDDLVEWPCERRQKAALSK